MWFLSDAVGIVVAAPLFIELGQRRELPPRAEVIQGVGVLALMALASIYAATLPPGSWLSFDPDAVVFPLLLWLAASNKRIFTIARSLRNRCVGATTTARAFS
jgi:integral membrane sensor domain MASE1